MPIANNGHDGKASVSQNNKSVRLNCPSKRSTRADRVPKSSRCAAHLSCIVDMSLQIPDKQKYAGPAIASFSPRKPVTIGPATLSDSRSGGGDLRGVIAGRALMALTTVVHCKREAYYL